MDLNEIIRQYPWFWQALLLMMVFFAIRYFSRRFFHVFGKAKPDPDLVKGKIADILEQTIPFYRPLSSQGKQKFIMRVAAFISRKKFIGMDGLDVTFEMKVRVAATAVKLTFGLNKSGLRHYRVIKIFPESFYSRMHDRFLKGGASTGGTLMFSWKDFEEGYVDPSDRYNLGLHEMAHALRLELKYGSDFDSRFADYNDHWEQLALPEFEKMNKGKTSFLRDYGGSNLEEFFAVCVEHFFEVPEEFRKQLPDVYNHLCFLLNLDPLRINSDYALDPDFIRKVNADPARIPLPSRMKRAYQYYDWHWSYSMALAGLFAGVFTVLFLYGKVLYTLADVLSCLLLATIPVLLFRKWFYSHGILGAGHLTFFTLTGVFPLLTASLLLLNYQVSSSVEVRVYRVEGFSKVLADKGGVRSRHLLLRLENDALSSYSSIRSFPLSDFKGADSMDEVRVVYTFSHGILGLKNLENRQIFIQNQGSEPFF